VLSTTGPHGLAFTGIPGTGGGVGDVATAPCSTGLPAVVVGVEAAGAEAAGFAADSVLTFCRSSAFSLSIRSSRATMSSSVAARAAPLNEIKQRAAQAVPERSLFLMTIPHRYLTGFNFRVRQLNVYQMPVGRRQRTINEIFVTCDRKGTILLLQCSISRISVSFQRVMTANQQFAWHYRADFGNQLPVIGY
jgi:hypothetical protein